MKRKIIACLLAALLLTVTILSGCAADKLAAKVGDTEITVSRLQNYYTSSISYASYYGYDVTTAEGVESFQDYLLDSMIASAARIYEANKAGVTLTDEELAQAETDAKEDYDEFYQEHLTAAENAGAADKNAYANKLMTETLVKNKTTVSKLKAQLLQDAKDAILVQKHQTQLLEGVTPTEDEIKAAYDKEAEAQKALFDATPSTYFTYEMYYYYGYSFLPVYVPEGFFYVRQILVESEDLAKEIKSKIDAGEDFETLLAEYNIDPGMESDSYKDGYIVGEGANFVEAFLTAALALEKEGDVSEPVKSDNGYHIIKRLGSVPSRVIDFAEMQETFSSYYTSSYQTEYYNNLVKDWMAQDYVERYPDNYRSIGKAGLAA